MTRRTGHLPDDAATVARRIGLDSHPRIGAVRAAALPLATNNRSKLPVAAGGPGILDQHDTGSCEGHAHASGVTLRFTLEGAPLPEVVSPVGLYLGALMEDSSPSGGKLPPLYDNGTYPSKILASMSRWGCAGASAWGQYPASSATMYLDPSLTSADVNYGILIPPKVEQLFSESMCRLEGAYFVQSSGLSKVLDVLSSLAAGYPVSMSIPASQSDFQGYRGGILGPTAGPVDHANLVVDYAWTGTQDQFTAWQAGAAGLDQYLVGYGVNSWGEGWGESDVPGIAGGLYRFNRAFFDMFQDACVLHVERSS